MTDHVISASPTCAVWQRLLRGRRGYALSGEPDRREAPSQTGQAPAPQWGRGMAELVRGIAELVAALRTKNDALRLKRARASRSTGDPEGGHGHCAEADPVMAPWKARRFPLRARISAWSMLTRPSVSADIHGEDRNPHEARRARCVQSLVMVPIQLLDPIGAIRSYRASRRESTSRQRHCPQALADSAAAATETMRLHEELEQARIEGLKRAVMAAETERVRWAHELHDQTLQTLAALQLRLAAARRRDDLDGWRQAGEQVGAQIEGEIANLRAIIADLRPPVLEELGLHAAIEALAGDHAHNNALRVHCDLSGERLALNTETEITVYRVVQEALTNVVKHARAQTATVRIVRDDDELTVVIADDGAGIDLEQPSSGFGLRGIRERVGLLGGTVVIESGAHGSTLRAVIPSANVEPRPSLAAEQAPDPVGPADTLGHPGPAQDGVPGGVEFRWRPGVMLRRSRG